MNINPSADRSSDTLTSLMVKLPGKVGVSTKAACKKSKVNLYKYKKHGSYPLIKSVFSFCDAFGIDPGCLITIVTRLESNEISEDHALEILCHWNNYKAAFEAARDLVFASVLKRMENAQADDKAQLSNTKQNYS